MATTTGRRALGNTGWTVAPIGLGGMPMSIQGRPGEEQSLATIDAALGAGIDLVDTADVYCLDDTELGHNERLIREGIRKWGGDGRVIVATKGGCTRPGGRWGTDGRPAHLRAACERSLKALGVDCIDLYQLHAPDSKVPIAESVGAMAELQRAGKVRHLGLSNVGPHDLDAARAVATIVSVQNRLSPWDTASFDNGTMAYCKQHGLVMLAHSPVGGHGGHARCADDATMNAIGARHGVSPYQVCLAWLLSVSPLLLPIPGASKPSSATSSAGAAGLTLTDADRAELARAFPAGRVA